MLKIINKFSVILVGGLALGSSIATASVNLKEAFQLALAKNEQLSQQRELLKQTEERAYQVKGALFPTIQGIGTYTRLPKPSGSVSPFTLYERPEARINLTQSIFRGGAEWAGMAQRNHQEDAQRYTVDRSTQALFLQVAEAYFQVLIVEGDLAELKKQIDVNQKRVRLLQDRRKIGRSRSSEVLLVESTLSSLQAEVAEKEVELVMARENLEVIAKVDRTQPLVSDQTLEILGQKFEGRTLEQWTQAIAARPDIKAAQALADAADSQVWISKAGHMPTLDVSGNYYLKRVGILESQKWDVTAQVVIPIFNGGNVLSVTRESVAAEKTANLELERLKAVALQEVRTLYFRIAANERKLAATASATDLAKRNYNEQSREYGYGLVTNLDVNTALNQWVTYNRLYLQTKWNTKLDVLRLYVAVGELPVKL